MDEKFKQARQRVADTIHKLILEGCIDDELKKFIDNRILFEKEDVWQLTIRLGFYEPARKSILGE